MANLLLEVFGNFTRYLDSNSESGQQELCLSKQAFEQIKQLASKEDDFWKISNDNVEKLIREENNRKIPELKSSEDDIREQVKKNIYGHVPMLPPLLSDTPLFRFSDYIFKISVQIKIV